MRHIVIRAPNWETLATGLSGITPEVLVEILRAGAQWDLHPQLLVHCRDAHTYCRRNGNLVVGNPLRWPGSPVRLVLRGDLAARPKPAGEVELWHLPWPVPRQLPPNPKTPVLLSLTAPEDAWGMQESPDGDEQHIDEELLSRAALITMPENAIPESPIAYPFRVPLLGRQLFPLPPAESTPPRSIAGRLLQLYHDILVARLPHQIVDTPAEGSGPSVLSLHPSSPTLGLVICTHNRPELLRATLTSLRQTILPSGTVLALVDDGSSDQETRRLVYDFSLETAPIHKIFRLANRGFGVHESLKIGWDFLHDRYGLTYFSNLDSDAILRRDWLVRSLELFQRERPHHNGLLVTGFHTARHPVKALYEDCYQKESCGGIHTLFDRELYHELIRPNLAYSAHDEFGWDWRVVAGMRRHGYPILCTRPSVLQHIGMFGQFSKGRHWLSRKQRWDSADDFIPDQAALAGLAAYESSRRQEAA